MENDVRKKEKGRATKGKYRNGKLPERERMNEGERENETMIKDRRRNAERGEKLKEAKFPFLP